MGSNCSATMSSYTAGRPTTRAERALYLGGAPGVGSRFLEPERKTTMLLGPYDNLQNRCMDLTSETGKLKKENEGLTKELSDANALITYLKKESDLHMNLVEKEQSGMMLGLCVSVLKRKIARLRPFGGGTKSLRINW